MSLTREDRWISLLGDLFDHREGPWSYVANARQCMALADRESAADEDELAPSDAD